MARLIVRVKYLIYNATEFGSNDQRVLSRIVYDLSVNGQKRGEFYSDLMHPVDTFDPEAIAVTGPSGYMGPFHHAVFARKIAAYYYDIVSRSSGHPSLRARTTPTANHRIIMPAEFELSSVESGPEATRPASSA